MVKKNDFKKYEKMYHEFKPVFEEIGVTWEILERALIDIVNGTTKSNKLCRIDNCFKNWTLNFGGDNLFCKKHAEEYVLGIQREHLRFKHDVISKIEILHEATTNVLKSLSMGTEEIDAIMSNCIEKMMKGEII